MAEQSTRASSDNQDALSLWQKEERGRKGRRAESAFMTHNDWKVHVCIKKYIFFFTAKGEAHSFLSE